MSLHKYSYIAPNLSLLPPYNQGSLSPSTQRDIRDEVLTRLAELEPLNATILEVKVVCKASRNFINLRIRPEYIPLLFFERCEETYFCFFMSDKLEPFVIITALHPFFGRLEQLSEKQLHHLTNSVAKFKTKFGITAESYHYTPLTERKETASSGVARENQSHSRHFHLKMRIGTPMLRATMQVTQLINLDALRKEAEPVIANYSRECMDWAQVFAEMKKDVMH